MHTSKKLTLLLSLCLIITVFLSIYLIGCSSLLTSTPKKPQAQTPASFVSVDINPTIDLILDQNNVVMSVTGANHDGKVLLFDEDGIVGSTLDVAISNITALAVKYDYLTAEINTISVSVVSREDSSNILQMLEDGITKTASGFQLPVSIEKEINLALEEELSDLKEKYPDNEYIQSLDTAGLCLAKRAQKNGEPIESICSKSLNELLARVNRMQSDAMSKFDHTYSAQVEKAQYLFDSANSVLQNGLRVCFYLENTSLLDISSLQKTLRSLEYTLAKATKLTLEYFDTCLDLNSVDERYYVDEDTLQKVADMLGKSYDEVMSKTHAQEMDGRIAIDELNLQSYINALYRNASDTVAEQIKDVYPSINEICSSSTAMVNGRDGVVEFLTQTLEDVFSSTQLSSLSVITNTYASHFATLIKGFLPDDLDISNKESIADAISQLNEKISALEEDFIQEDEQAFTEYCEQNKLAQNLLELRDQLASTLADIKQNAINSLSQEKATRL